jgi:hypothetical protein
VLFPNRDPIISTPLSSPLVCNTMMTDFIARLSEFRFAIISSLTSADVHNLRKINIIDIDG